MAASNKERLIADCDAFRRLAPRPHRDHAFGPFQQDTGALVPSGDAGAKTLRRAIAAAE
jgi:hypothetical protein